MSEPIDPDTASVTPVDDPIARILSRAPGSTRPRIFTDPDQPYTEEADPTG